MRDVRLSQKERVAMARLQAMLELLPAALDRALLDIGVTSFEYTLLEALAEDPTSRMRLSALAARTNATLPRLSRVVNALERKGLAERAPCPQDARATYAVLTCEGHTRYQQARPLYAEAVRSMVLDALDDQQVDNLAELMLTILAQLDPTGRLDVTSSAVPCAGTSPLTPATPCPTVPAPLDPQIT